jgi:AbrB family looped-hinge helix DNA binding protein
MRVTDKGQVTIPKQLREEFGIAPGTKVEFEATTEGILVRRSAGEPSRGTRLVEQLRGKGDVRMTTDEIMALTRGE